jgi:hypothetical protein
VITIWPRCAHGQRLPSALYGHFAHSGGVHQLVVLIDDGRRERARDDLGELGARAHTRASIRAVRGHQTGATDRGAYLCAYARAPPCNCTSASRRRGSNRDTGLPWAAVRRGAGGAKRAMCSESTALGHASASEHCSTSTSTSTSAARPPARPMHRASPRLPAGSCRAWRRPRTSCRQKTSPPMAASRLVGGAGRDTGSGQGQGRACHACLILLAKCAADCACAGALWARRAPVRASSRAGPSAAAACRQEPEDGGVPGWERRPVHDQRGL